jgi:hypothetical protein
MEKYKQYKTLIDILKESKNWINNKNKIDSQSHTSYSLHNISFSADYCGQAYAGANNYHSSPKEFNAYMSKAIKRNFSQLTDEAILLMEEDVKKALIACELEINEMQKNIELSKLDVVAGSE